MYTQATKVRCRNDLISKLEYNPTHQLSTVNGMSPIIFQLFARVFHVAERLLYITAIRS